MPRGDRWEPKEDDILRRFKREQRPWREAAIRLSRTPRACRERARVIGLCKRQGTREKWSAAMTQRLKSLRAAGASASECAALLSAEFGRPLTRNAVIGKLYRMRKSNV